MNKQKIIHLIVLTLFITGCGLTRIDPWHVMIRSDVIRSLDEEKRIVDKAKLTWSEDGNIRVLVTRGTPYERGYQQGVLLRREIQDNLGTLYERGSSKFHFPEIFDEAYERQRPFIPQEYVDEMHGLAHGSRMPLRVIHAIHALPEIGEWGGKKRLQKIIRSMMKGDPEWGTSCSNFAVGGSKTIDNAFYVVRLLDWGLHRISKLHKYPLILVNIPDNGVASVNIGWAGFLGAISGMNEEGITLGEMGYQNPENETLAGKPMPFLLRDVMTYAHNLPEVRHIIQTSPGTNSFVYLMSDGKVRDAELYIRDHDRFQVLRSGQEFKEGDKHIVPVNDALYGGHDNQTMARLLNENSGKIDPDLIMDKMVPEIAMRSNFQNVIYDPANLSFWVSNALNKDTSAATQPFTYFNLGETLKQVRAEIAADKK